MTETESKFWKFLWACVTVFLVAASISAYNINVTNRMAETIAQGADPVATSCAMTGDMQARTIANR